MDTATPIDIAPAHAADLPDVLALLERSRLPSDGLAAHVASTLVAKDRGRIVGSAALELHGRVGLLRSVAVAPSQRGRGLGERLTHDRIAWARDNNLRALYLLTTTAADYFAVLGFCTLDRREAPHEIRTSREFSDACPQSAVFMHLPLQIQS